MINTLTEWHTALSEKLIVVYLFRYPAIYGPTKFISRSHEAVYCAGDI
jgi:hypothetical protein